MLLLAFSQSGAARGGSSAAAIAGEALAPERQVRYARVCMRSGRQEALFHASAALPEVRGEAETRPSRLPAATAVHAVAGFHRARALLLRRQAHH